MCTSSKIVKAALFIDNTSQYASSTTAGQAKPVEVLILCLLT